MMQAALNFDPDPYPPNPFKYGSQNWRLYERLKEGPTTNIEIVSQMHILNSTGRVSEIREFLKGNCMDLVAKPLGSGHWVYHIA